MSRERELLKRTMDFLECFVFYSEGLELREAIRDFLSTPEPEQDEEPVGQVGKCHTVAWFKKPEPLTYLFLHPAPRKHFARLSEDEVTEVLTSAYDMYAAICAAENMLARKNK